MWLEKPQPWINTARCDCVRKDFQNKFSSEVNLLGHKMYALKGKHSGFWISPNIISKE